MSEIAIRAENLGKQFRIARRQEPYYTMRDTLTDFFIAPFRRTAKLLKGQPTGAAELDENFWALENISFEVKQGEVVGVIGRNGAGKTTLLKILSRIVEPTLGCVEIHGRVGSLLEVGTGFHPELTGRENTYLNGAILGMKKTEIDRKFDEIVAFADIEKFVETPVKHYSSGMYLRLAFSVAAHLEPEILIVDEVLAVGDASFQRKCLNKMEDVAQRGRTVLFVSHNMPAVTRLCKRVMLLDEGCMQQDGPTHWVVGAYLKSGRGTTAIREWPNQGKAPSGNVVRLCAVRVRGEDGLIQEVVDIRQTVRIEMEYEVLESGYVLLPIFHFYNDAGIHAFGSHDLDPTWRRRPRPKGQYVSTVWIPGNYLSEGPLFVRVGLGTLEPKIWQFWEADVVSFVVIDSTEGDSARGDYGGNIGGVVRPLLKWTTQYSSTGNRLSLYQNQRKMKGQSLVKLEEEISS